MPRGSTWRRFHEINVVRLCPKQPFGLLKAASEGLDNGNSVSWEGVGAVQENESLSKDVARSLSQSLSAHVVSAPTIPGKAKAAPPSSPWQKCPR